MATVKLTNVKKVYGKDVVAVDNFNLDIADKEFVVFVGPSGCGKSTTLRMIAGLEEISGGTIEIDDRIVNDLQPKDRNIAMVFQNYALYPHLSVFENMAFSLRLKKVPQDEVYKKVTEAAEVLGITDLLMRKPRQLSGGQRQRVAIGRAMVRDSKVFLMDEPLSNLDAKLRNQMRAEIILLRQKIDTTFVYVTHDQTEAMTLGDRIVIMKDGLIQQVGTPTQVFDMPANLFVAEFIGAPKMNTFETELVEDDGRYYVTPYGAKIEVLGDKADALRDKEVESQHIVLGVRPEHIYLTTADDKNAIPCTVEVNEMMGGEIHLHVVVENGDKLVVRVQTMNLTPEQREGLACGNQVYITFEGKVMHFFHGATNFNLLTEQDLTDPKKNIAVCHVENDTLTVGNAKFNLPSAMHQEEVLDGEVVIPTDAITLGEGNNNAVVADFGPVGDRKLYQLTLGDATLQAIVSGAIAYNVGDKVAFDIDLKRVSVKVEDGGIKALKMDNSVDGAFIKVKEVQPNGKKGYTFYIQIGDQKVAADDVFSQKLIDRRGARIFKTPLRYEFNTSLITIVDEAEGAFATTVSEVLDYGKERFALLTLNDAKVCVALGDREVSVGDTLHVTINQAKLGVMDRALELPII